jgi:hypothetical protein
MKQSSDDDLKVNIFGWHGFQTCDQVIKSVEDDDVDET